MKPIGCYVNWMLKWANHPMIEILVDKIPESEDLRYTHKENYYLALKDDFASFFAYSRPDRGFGGRQFELTMIDGSKQVLEGPWSGNESSANQIFGLELVSVSLTDDVQAFMRGHTFCSGSVTVDFVAEALRHFETKYALKIIQDQCGSFFLNKTGKSEEPRKVCNVLRRRPQIVRSKVVTGVPRMCSEMSGEQCQIIMA